MKCVVTATVKGEEVGRITTLADQSANAVATVIQMALSRDEQGHPVLTDEIVVTVAPKAEKGAK